MDSELTACCEKIVRGKPTQGQIKKVENGYIIEGYDFKTKVANTIDEALALLKKELE